MRSPLLLVVLSSSLLATHASADSVPAQTCTPDPAPVAAPGVTKQVATPETPRAFEVSIGAFEARRGMSVYADPESSMSPPEYPGQPLQGAAMHVGWFPARFGITADAAVAINSTMAALDQSGYGDYTMKHTSLEAGAHFRQDVLRRGRIDASLNVGRTSYTIADLPESMAIPDVAYSYVGGVIRLDANVFRGARIGASARYDYLLGAGDLSSDDWYGHGKAYGLGAGLDVVVPLPHHLYAKAAVDYREFTTELEGTGQLAQAYGAWSIVDQSISATAQVGAKF